MIGKNLYVISKGVFRLTIIILQHVYYISYLTWIITIYPLKLFGFQDIFYKIEGQLQYGMLKIIAMWSQTAGYKVFETGDDITKCLDERTLVLVNHQSTGDVPMLFNAFVNKKQVLPNIMWILDWILKFSHFGLVCTIRRDFFIHQGKDKRDNSLNLLTKHIHNYYIPIKRNWLVLFPEGGFLYKRRERSQIYGKRNNLPHLEHVTIPRIGALEIIINELHPKKYNLNNNTTDISIDHLKYVLDITIGYENGKPVNPLDIMLGTKEPIKTTILYRLYKIDDIPDNKDDLNKWLLKKWVEKEELLKNFYKNGKFENYKTPILIRQNLLNHFFLNIAFLSSTFIHYQIYSLIFNYFFS